MGKPKGEHATFESSCFKCAGDVTVTNGRPDPHQCQPWTRTIHATDEEVEDAQGIRQGILSRLEAVFENR